MPQLLETCYCLSVVLRGSWGSFKRRIITRTCPSLIQLVLMLHKPRLCRLLGNRLVMGTVMHHGGWAPAHVSGSAHLLARWPSSPQWHCWVGWWPGGWRGAPCTRRPGTASRPLHCSCVWNAWWRCNPLGTRDYDKRKREALVSIWGAISVF